MKAVVLSAPETLELVEMPKPKCEREGLIVRVITACICNGSDPTMFRDKKRSDYPVVFGHEAYGEIVEVGSDVEGYKVGEKISWWYSPGAFAEYTVIRPMEIAVVRLNDSVPTREGPIFELVAAASRAVFACDVKGKKVIIQGLGPSGLIMAQLCRELGAKEVVGLDLYENRRMIGAEYGCKTELRRNDYDILIDAFGDEAGGAAMNLNEALEHLSMGAELVLYGQPEHGRTIDYRILQNKQLSVKLPTNDIPKIREMVSKSLELYYAGRLELSRLITDEITLADVPEAIMLVKDHPDEHIKIIVNVERS